jgi:hypothetical protein
MSGDAVTLKVRVFFAFAAFARAGPLVLNAPTDLPDGMVELVPIDDLLAKGDEVAVVKGDEVAVVTDVVGDARPGRRRCPARGGRRARSRGSNRTVEPVSCARRKAR